MKKLFLLLSGALLFANLFVSTGCEDDPEVKNPPLVTVADTPIDALAPGADFTFSVTADKGTDELNSLTITLDGANLDAALIAIENIATANNPQAITDADRNGLTYNITITAPDAPGVYSYEVTVEDAGALSDFAGFDVTIDDPTTPITGDITGALLNQAGPAGTGGLDLDTGDGTGSADPSAELRDWGINSGPVADNWIQKIGAATENTDGSGARFATVRFFDQNLETLDFDAVITEEAIADAWTKATDLVDNMSDVVEEGDIFVVENSTTGRLYLVRIDSITVTPDNNADQYEVSIKF